MLRLALMSILAIMAFGPIACGGSTEPANTAHREPPVASSVVIPVYDGDVDAIAPTTPTPTPTLTPTPTPSPTPELTDGTYVWRYGAWRDPVTERAYEAPTPLPIEVARGPIMGGVAAPASCPALIASTFGWAGCAISFCESGWSPGATGAQGEMGYFQIHPQYHSDATYDPAGNVAAAWRISRGGVDWGAWSVRAVLYTGICPNGIPVP